jgi:hypothetical protein
MSMQTRKARAHPLAEGLWRITHPDVNVEVHAHYPHDCAEYLIRFFVLAKQVGQAITRPSLGV